MRLILSRLLLLAVVAALSTTVTLAAQVVVAPAARACSIVPSYEVSLDDLQSPQLNQPDSSLVLGYQAFASTDQVLTIEGAYLVETVLTVEANDDWTRGSVNTITRTWGEPPASVAPFVHRTVEVNSDDCPPHGDGPDRGELEIRLVTSPETNVEWVSFEYESEEQAFSVLKNLFGTPFGIDQDPDEEARLLRTLNNARPGSAIPVAIVFGIGLVVFGCVSYWRRHRQLVANWAEIKAEADAQALASEAI